MYICRSLEDFLNITLRCTEATKGISVQSHKLAIDRTGCAKSVCVIPLPIMEKIIKNNFEFKVLPKLENECNDYSHIFNDTEDIEKANQFWQVVVLTYYFR